MDDDADDYGKRGEQRAIWVSSSVIVGRNRDTRRGSRESNAKHGQTGSLIGNISPIMVLCLDGPVASKSLEEAFRVTFTVLNDRCSVLAN